MKQSSKYDTSGLIEAQFEPGSGRRVLENLLGIKSKREMDHVEAREQLHALQELSGAYDISHRFTARDVCRIHEAWLGGIYKWAGRYRQVNVSKGNFQFAAAAHVPNLMDVFERGPLREFTPCKFGTLEEIARALAVVHTELVLIHPFREGNGRVARLLSILMGLQAGLPPLDFSGILSRKKKEYITAVQAGMDRDYTPMERIFKSVIRRTLRVRGGK